MKRFIARLAFALTALAICAGVADAPPAAACCE